MSKSALVLSILALANLGVYLFVSAPEPLPEANRSGAVMSAQQALTILNSENARVRAIYTRDIVGAGLKAGLKFSEDWQEPSVDAGPLPALFLRETSRRLERRPVQLGLFLGSKYPIQSANRFAGDQSRYFEGLETGGPPAFFYSADTQRHTAMFPDPAGVQACVTCHNEHPDSPKTDWKLDDVMGATTWTLPAEHVTLAELLELIDALRGSVAEAYTLYLDRAQHFVTPPAIGEHWPADGYALPSTDVFMARVRSANDTATMGALLATHHKSGPDAPAQTAAMQP